MLWLYEVEVCLLCCSIVD